MRAMNAMMIPQARRTIAVHSLSLGFMSVRVKIRSKSNLKVSCQICFRLVTDGS